MTNYKIKHKKIKLQKLKNIDIGTSTDKQLKDYKIFVFDLDNTLFLHKVGNIYREQYNKKLKNFLNYLKDNDKLLYIATHNFNPNIILYEMNILPSFFTGIIKETKDVWSNLNTIDQYTSKKDMILDILNNNKNFSKNDIIFFDDAIYNIKQVESIHVKSIYVQELNGINFSEIY